MVVSRFFLSDNFLAIFFWHVGVRDCEWYAGTLASRAGLGRVS
jgi:hypothetical protein